MAYHISTSPFAFVQFAESDQIESCGFDDTHMCLPVFEASDVMFPWYITADTQEEADELCDLDAASVSVGLVQACADGFLLEFAQKPQRYRISDTQLLYVWNHGLPGFDGVIDIAECFHIKIRILLQTFCSNCFQRIKETCYTTVLEYYNDDNAFGFAYCPGGEGIGETTDDCVPTIIQFSNQETMIIPWTASLNAKYGSAPNVQVWVNDGGELVQAGLRVAYDAYPPTELRIDFGGTASGIVKIF